MKGIKHYKYDDQQDCYIITDLESGSETLQSMQQIYKKGQIMKDSQKEYHKKRYFKKLAKEKRRKKC